MADLEIDYELHPVFTAAPDVTYFLDREFLSHGEDRSLSRAPDAPCLRHRVGSWWIDNDSDRNEATVTLWSTAIGRQYVPRGCSFALPDGPVELYPWDGQRYRIALNVSRSDTATTRPGRAAAARQDEVTLVGQAEADVNVTTLFAEKPRTRTILAALYQQYLGRGYTAPRPLTRREAASCMGFPNPGPIDAALQDVQVAVWGGQGHSDQVPAFLVHRGHLEARHQMLIPHRDCGHRAR